MVALADLTGSKFGKLTAIEYANGKWLCECECGTRKLVFPGNLKRGLTKSCGCSANELRKSKSSGREPIWTKEKQSEYIKEYRRKNREALKEKRRKYEEENKELVSFSKKRCYEAKKEQYKARVKANYDANPSKKIEYQKAYAEKNKEKISDYLKKYLKDYYLKNPHYLRMRSATYRAALNKAIPKWACFDEIKKIYEKAKAMTDETGVQYEVDHVIPLRGKNVCGLHCHTNMQILTAEENIAKSNKHES
jgi:hypothetical protein